MRPLFLEVQRLIDEVKMALRIKNTAYDEEINGLIDACNRDLNMAGVEITNTSDPMVKQAVKLYCKGYFGYGDKAEAFIQAYEGIKMAMSLCGDYKGGDTNV